MNARLEHQMLLAQVEEAASPEHQEGMRRVLSTSLRVYGVRVPQLREIARAWYHKHKGVACEDLLGLAETLLAGESREEQLVAIYLLGHYKRCIPTLTQGHLDRWRRRVDCWEASDGLAQWMLAMWILAEPESRIEYLRTLVADQDVWSRRIALIATTTINEGKTGFTAPDLTLELIDRVKEEHHPMITKAISWALRELSQTHKDRVAAYLEETRDALPPHAVREVENKLHTGLKSGKR